MIIPIIFRGEEYLPKEIKERRQCYYFDDFLLCDPKMSEHPKYAKKIMEIAKYIFERYQTFAQLPVDPCAGCDSFELPSDIEIKPLITGTEGLNMAFPGRRVN